MDENVTSTFLSADTNVSVSVPSVDESEYTECSFLSKRKVERVSFSQKKQSYKPKTTDVTLELIETCEGEYDIYTLDRQIRDIIKNNKDKIPNHKTKLERLEWIRDNTIDVIERKDAINQIFKLNREIKKYSNYNQLKEYEKLTRPIFESYDRLLAEPEYCSFLKSSESNNSNDMERKALLNQYYQIAIKYVKINPLKKSKKSAMCPNCSCKNFNIDDDDVMYCVGCHTCIETLESSPAFKDKERINMSKRFRYSCSRHFKEALDKRQGKQNTYINPKIVELINEFIEQNNNISKETLTYEHVYLVLQMYGFTDKYEDIYLIHSMVTGIPPDDLSKYEDQLIKDFEKQQNIASEIKISNSRKNSLNVYYVLCRLLQRLGYKCKLQDFHCLKTDDTKDEHDHVWCRRCERLKWTPILD